jgi:hypothetical protein
VGNIAHIWLDATDDGVIAATARSIDLPVGSFGVESFISDFPNNICSL